MGKMVFVFVFVFVLDPRVKPEDDTSVSFNQAGIDSFGLFHHRVSGEFF